MRRVSSRHNPIVRTLRALAASPDAEGVRLLLDGAHLVDDAQRAGLAFEVAAVAASRLDRESDEARLARALDAAGVDVMVASDDLFSVLSPTRSPSGIVAIVHRRPARLDEIADAGGFILVAVDVQDPGNLGALLRAAEAGGVSGALVCASRNGSSANPLSWKALRGSMGSALRLPIAYPMPAEEVVDRLIAGGTRVAAAVPRGGHAPDEIDWTGNAALVLGGEGPGLPTGLVARCSGTVSVPMAAGVESLNVAVAGGVLIYTARRQRVPQ
jgi:TrmH family RNA methyltransferase